MGPFCPHTAPPASPGRCTVPRRTAPPGSPSSAAARCDGAGVVLTPPGNRACPYNHRRLPTDHGYGLPCRRRRTKTAPGLRSLPESPSRPRYRPHRACPNPAQWRQTRRWTPASAPLPRSPQGLSHSPTFPDTPDSPAEYGGHHRPKAPGTWLSLLFRHYIYCIIP